ncbi:hypothetical protein Moror_2991 [Moniliophthora roreri MCA 2997]|uniref:F-box domain-containing protein n=2 Tax=Moniliophthora roreri TaxID=221103 RepID=V2YAL7_MONRO|nr:hypothetical protein Moror_2991 [Moniliophthora roreri MCA 2997]KAI3596554.1 hypothetical protein WG66_003392 [Moniliophthora roreri]
MTGVPTLPFDILLHVMELAPDRRTLYDCITVSRAFNEAALPSLYQSISLVILRNNSSGSLNFAALETLDHRTHLRPYVKSVDLCFGLADYVRYQSSHRPTPAWAESLSKLPNIESFTLWHPERRYHPLPHDFSDTVIAALAGCSSLSRLTLLARVNFSDIARFSRIPNVRGIRIGLLTTGVYDALGAWIKKSDCTLLGMMDTYTLESPVQIAPHIGNLHHLHIGRNHGLTNRDLLQVLAVASQLRTLDIFFDNFLSASLSTQGAFNGLEHLQRLVLRHQGVSSKNQYNELFDWIAIVTASSPLLSSLSLQSDDEKECNFPGIPTKLISLLLKFPNLEVLDLPYVVMRQASLTMILTNLDRLRVLSMSLIDDRALAIPLDAQTHISQLNALYLRSNRATCPYSNVQKQVEKLMARQRGYPGYIRRVVDTRRGWQALWTDAQNTGRKGLSVLKDEYQDTYSDLWY